MTPTEQDKKLRELFVMYGYPRLTQAELKLIPAIEHYITADRKRVELEARIDELEKLSNIDWSDDGIEANDMVCEELKFRIAKLRSRNHLGKEEV